MTVANDEQNRPRRIRGWLRGHKTAVWVTSSVVVVLFVGAVLAGIFWFEFHKAFIDDEVQDEVIEVADPPPASPGDTVDEAAPPSEPVLVSEGEFISIGHEGSGIAQIIEAPDGTRKLQLLDLNVSNGPDLRVLLSPSELSDDRNAYNEGFFDLAELRGNVGNQTYQIPAEVDLTQYRSVAIWCRRFNYTFNAAPIAAT